MMEFVYRFANIASWLVLLLAACVVVICIVGLLALLADSMKKRLMWAWFTAILLGITLLSALGAGAQVYWGLG